MSSAQHQYMAELARKGLAVNATYGNNTPSSLILDGRATTHNGGVRKSQTPSSSGVNRVMTAASSLRSTRATSRKVQSNARRQQTASWSTFPALNSQEKTFEIAVDYGTTTTAVSYISYPTRSKPVQILHSGVKYVKDWPLDPQRGSSIHVPTLSWYPRGRAVGHDETPHNQKSLMPGQSYYSDGGGILAGDASKRFASQENSLQRDSEESARYLWGFDAQRQAYKQETDRNKDRFVSRAKLMLLSTAHTKADRDRLSPVLEHLIDGGLIRRFGPKGQPSSANVQDVIADFLVQVLKHTREQIVLSEGYTPNCHVSFTLTVPSIWSAQSSRVLQSAMEIAIQLTEFCQLDHGNIDNLFLMTEPEAACNHIVSQDPNLLPGDSFIVVDAGGGTVDVSTYTLESSLYPLQLGNEVVTPTGDNCGASYLNSNLEKLLLLRLAKEEYLNANSYTIESLVEEAIADFEDVQKRVVDVAENHSAFVKIPNLRGDIQQGKKNGFVNNNVVLNVKDFKTIFDPLLSRSWRLLKRQIEDGLSKDKEVRKAYLIGGFGASPSMKSYLRKELLEFQRRNFLAYEIELISNTQEACTTAVVCGAILWAMQRGQGPDRSSSSSYGFLRGQLYDPSQASHKGAPTKMCDFDGEFYVQAIEYFVYKTKILPLYQEFEPITFVHHFDLSNSEIRCEELLYVSDSATKSNFSIHSPVNKDCRIVGTIMTDFTFLLKEGNVTKEVPTETTEDGTLLEPYYVIQYQLVPIIDGRKLRYESRYSLPGEPERVLEARQISLAPAFPPGAV